MSIIIDVVRLLAYATVITAAVVFSCCCVCIFAKAYLYFKDMPRITRSIAKRREQREQDDAYRKEIMTLCASMVADGHLGKIMMEVRKSNSTATDESVAEYGARLLVRNAIRLHQSFEEFLEDELEQDGGAEA